MRNRLRHLARLAALTLVLSCASCGDVVYKEIITLQPTCTQPGEGYVVAMGDTNEFYEPKAIPALGHLIAETTFAPSCTADGYTRVYCQRCGEIIEKKDVIPAFGHNFVTRHIDPDCTHEGHEECYCTRCGIDQYEPFYIDALGHDYVLDEVVPATCEAEGYQILRCSRCGRRIKGETYERLEHHWLYVQGKAATCLEGGYSDYRYCSLCGLEDGREVYPALGHDFIHHEGKSSTCTEAGHYEYDQCSRCGFSNYKPIEPMGHKYVMTYHEATCLEGGYQTHTCQYCGDHYVDNVVPAHGHDYEYFPELAPQCGLPGHKAYKVCRHCGDTDYEEIPPEEGDTHSYVEEIVEPTKSNYGYTLHTCTKCGDSYRSDLVAPLTPVDYLDAAMAIAKGVHPNKYTNSIRDDDYYYFVAYLGQLVDVPVHTFASFEYDEGLDKLGTYPKDIVAAMGMDVLETYNNHKAIWSSSIASTVLKKTPLTPKDHFSVQEGDGSLLSPYADKLFAGEGFAKLPLEIDDVNASKLTAKINALDVDFAPEIQKDGFDLGLTYNYVATVDYSLYAGVRVDLANDIVTYTPYASVDDVKADLYASVGKLTVDIPTFVVAEAASESMSKPATYQTNHPLRTFDFYDSEEHVQNVGGGYNGRFTFSNNAGRELYHAGYDCAYFEVHYSYWVSYGVGNYVISQIVDSNFESSVGGEYKYEGNEGVNVSYSFKTSAFSLFGEANAFGLIINSYTWSGISFIKKIHYYNIHVKVTLYNSHAAEEGAYGDF